MRAVVTRSPKDTTRFAAPATASRCVRGGGILLQATTGGNGVLAWLRTPDSIAAGPWPLLQRGDTVSRHGATIAVRYVQGDIARGAAFDSGSVVVTPKDRTVTIHASGGGMEASVGHVALEVTFEAVPLGTDTVSCAAHL